MPNWKWLGEIFEQEIQCLNPMELLLVEVPTPSTAVSRIISVRTYVFHMLRTYIMILFNWLIFWQNALYLYLGRLKMCLNTSKNHVSRSSVKAFKFVQEIKEECKFIKARQLLNSFSTPPIYRGLRISEFKSDFLGIREYVFRPSFLLTLDI